MTQTAGCKLSESDLHDPVMRRLLGGASFELFCVIYFPQLFKVAMPDFHRRWYQLFKFVNPETKKRFTYLILMAFRDSAKSSLAKLWVVWCICYKKRNLISYVCYDKDKSGEALFDVATWLQTNELLIKDFGNLFESSDQSNRPEKKTIDNFVTSNGIRVTALSIKQSVRGRIFAFDRPDCYVIDDFENNLTKKSAVVTRKVIDFFKELIGGISGDAQLVFLCNRISDTGSVQWLLDTAEGDPQFVVEERAVVENGVSIWPSKFVLTDEEAEIINMRVTDPDERVVSLEAKKRSLNSDGSKTYEQEYLNQPYVKGDRFFDLERIDARIEFLRTKKYQSEDPAKPNYFKDDGLWKRWSAWDKNHMNVIAADVSEGYGRDSSVIQGFDITTGTQICEFESNECPPDVLSELMITEGVSAGYCLLCPERNSIGVAVVNDLKKSEYPRQRIFREKTVDSTTEKPIHKFGWHTNSKTKPLMLFQFKKDFEAGLIIINSIPLLREMRAFSMLDIDHKSFDPEVSNHFDRLVAACIAWQMRNVPQIRIS